MNIYLFTPIMISLMGLHITTASSKHDSFAHQGMRQPNYTIKSNPTLIEYLWRKKPEKRIQNHCALAATTFKLREEKENALRKELDLPPFPPQQCA